MVPRIPTKQDFPQSLVVDIVPPPPNHPASNILLLLHGLGDTNAPFTNFARAMALPDTCAVSVRAPAPLPFDLPGFHWGDDIIFDQQSSGSQASGTGAEGGPDVDAGFAKATKLITQDIIRDTLVRQCGYVLRDILLFGFGQGGMLALNVASCLDDGELGGVVSIGSGLPSEATRVTDISVKSSRKRSTPVIVCKARDGSAVSDEDEDRLKEHFMFVEIKEWARKGDGMPRNRDEMLPVMQFFARRLRSLRGVPAGSVEISI